MFALQINIAGDPYTVGAQLAAGAVVAAAALQLGARLLIAAMGWIARRFEGK